MADFKYIAIWWLTYFFLGLLSLPLGLRFFRSFWDKGYIFTKIFTSVILTYLILVLGVFKFLPFTHTSLTLLIALAVGLNIFHLKKGSHWREFSGIIKSHLPIFLGEELLFLLILTLWSYVRGFAPDIEGLEKFMDWGFVNSALRTHYLPPVDMWFSGQPINYYYFGHLITALTTRLSTLDSALTYNLAIASTCAFTFVGAFSVASNLVHLYLNKIPLRFIITAGMTSALLITFGGNLHSVYKISKNIIKNEGSLQITPDSLQTAIDQYWYPDATRFIGFDPDVKDKTIHEFPLYSFVVADLHGHMNNIPHVLFFLAFLLASVSTLQLTKFNPLFVVFSGFWLSINYMTNAWDFAVYGLVFGSFVFFHALHKMKLLSAIRFALIHGIPVIIAWYIFTLPFSLNFVPMTEGLRWSDTHTPFYQLFVLYGGFWLICFPLIVFLVSRRFRQINYADIFSLSLIFVATLMIIIPEIGYIKDIYVYDHRRANTMFKLVYQAFMMYSLVAGYVLIRLSQSIRNGGLKLLYKLVFSLVFVIHLIYPYFAIRSYYGLRDFKSLGNYKGLYGLNFLRLQYPDNLAAINWLNQHITGQPVVLEATGDSYTTFNQVSTATGLPTVQGWVVHEWLWRGGYDQPSARQNDVQKIYESTNVSEVRSLLQKYNVKYIFVGAKEIEKYSHLNTTHFEALGAKIIFESGKTKIYQL